jgi:hypothetical protein
VSVLNPAKAGERPKAGTMPHLIVEVDTTPPEAELYEPRTDPNVEHGLLISWKSRDPHLPSRPVSLYFAEKPNGDLYPIATGLPPEGEHSWIVPAGIPYQVHLVLRAEDLGGNMSQAITGEPILVDFSKPKAAGVEIITALPDETPVR